MKIKIYKLFCLFVGISVNICAQQKVDTVNIKILIEQNSVLKNNNFNSSIFRIVAFEKFSDDSSRVTFEVISNENWNKKNNAYKGYFSGILVKESKFYFNGDFIYSIINSKNKPVSTIGTYNYDKLNGIVNVRTPEYFISKTIYKNDLKNGMNLLYYGDNKENVNEISFYANDTLEGKKYLFFENGGLMEEVNYVKGKKSGEQIAYFKNGKTKSVTNFNNNVPIGKAKEFYENGTLKATGEYSGNYIVGEVECDTCNNKKFIYKSHLGKTLDVQKLYSLEFKKELGQVMRNWSFKEKNIYPLKKGTWVYYKEDGTINKKVTYDKVGNIL